MKDDRLGDATQTNDVVMNEVDYDSSTGARLRAMPLPTYCNIILKLDPYAGFRSWVYRTDEVECTFMKWPWII